MTVITTVCPVGIWFTASRVFIDPEAGTIEIWCDFYNCPSRGVHLCPCADGTETPCIILSFKEV